MHLPIRNTTFGTYETLVRVKKGHWALEKYFYGLWWRFLNTGRIVQKWIWADGEFKLILLIYCCISLHLFLFLTARLLDSKNSNSNQTPSWQNGKLHIIFIIVCLLGITLAFIKIVLLIFPLFYQRLRAVMTKSKMIYLSPGEGKLIKIALFLFGLVLLFSLYFNWNTLNSPHGYREHWEHFL